MAQIFTQKKYTSEDKTIPRVVFDYAKKEIRVRDQSESLIEVEKLPSMLNYTTVYDKSKLTEVSTKTDSKGGLTNSFSIYIFDVNNNVSYRISIDSISNPSGMAYINIYQNKSSNITFDNVQDEHYEFNSNQWIKE